MTAESRPANGGSVPDCDLNRLSRILGRSRERTDDFMSLRGNRKTARSWRWADVTQKQRDWLLKHGIPESIVNACDRGMASVIMTILIRNSQEAWAWGFGGGRINDHDFI